MSRESQNGSRRKRRKQSQALKILLVLLTILLVLVVIVFFILTRSKPEKDEGVDFDISLEDEGDDLPIDPGDNETIDETADSTVTEIPEDLLDTKLEDTEDTVQLTKDEGWEHYLLLGVDGEGSGYKGKRSDAMIVASINKEENKVSLSSIPRDVLVYIDGKGFDKLTHAYAYGGAALTVKTFAENFDIDISGYVTINFAGMVKLVDTLGGLTLTLTEAEAKNMSDYYAAWGVSSGTHVLSGKEVLAYCRVRKIDSDYKRNDRQFAVIQKIYEKAKTMSYTKYAKMITDMYDYVNTDLTVADLISLAQTALEVLDGGALVNNKLVDSTNSYAGSLHGTSYVMLNDLGQVVTDWRANALGIEGYVPNARVKQIAEQLRKQK